MTHAREGGFRITKFIIFQEEYTQGMWLEHTISVNDKFKRWFDDLIGEMDTL